MYNQLRQELTPVDISPGSTNSRSRGAGSAGHLRSPSSGFLDPRSRASHRMVTYSADTSVLPFASKIEGFYIENYNASKLLNDICACGSLRGSVFDWPILKSVLFYNLVALIYGVLLKYTSVVVVFSAAQALVFTSLASFLMASYTGTIFARWWKMRTDLQAVVGNLTTFCFVFGSMVNRRDRRQLEKLQTARRWCLLAHAMLWLSVNDADADQFCDKLISEEKLLPNEKHELSMSDASNAVIIYHWMFELVSQHGRSMGSRREIFMEQYCMKCIQTAFASTSSVVMHVKQQIPYAFAHLMSLVIRVHLFCFALYAGGPISKGFGATWWEVFWGLVMTSFNSAIFTGLFQIHITLENPMNGDPNDFSWQHFEKLIAVNTALGIDGCEDVLVTERELEEAAASGGNFGTAAVEVVVHPSAGGDE